VNQWLALVIAIIGGAVAAWVGTIALVAVVYGSLWIYVFGDSSWPDWVDPVLGTVAVLGGLMIWVAVGWFIWKWSRSA